MIPNHLIKPQAAGSVQFTLPRLFLNGRSNINSISLELTKFIFVFLQLPPELSKQLIPFTFSLNVNFKFDGLLDEFKSIVLSRDFKLNALDLKIFLKRLGFP